MRYSVVLNRPDLANHTLEKHVLNSLYWHVYAVVGVCASFFLQVDTREHSLLFRTIRIGKPWVTGVLLEPLIRLLLKNHNALFCSNRLSHVRQQIISKLFGTFYTLSPHLKELIPIEPNSPTYVLRRVADGLKNFYRRSWGNLAVHYVCSFGSRNLQSFLSNSL